MVKRKGGDRKFNWGGGGGVRLMRRGKKTELDDRCLLERGVERRDSA